MADDSKPQSWWQTLPGVLTALTGMIGAIGTLLVALNSAGLLKSSSTTQPAPSVAPAVAASSAGARPSAGAAPVVLTSAASTPAAPIGGEAPANLDSRVDDLVHRYLAVQRSGNVPDLIDLYGDQVDYFGHQGVSRDFVLKDKLNYYRVWTVERNQLVGKITIANGPDPDEKTATFMVNFRATNARQGKTSQGDATNVLTIRTTNDRLLIIGENQTFDNQAAY